MKPEKMRIRSHRFLGGDDKNGYTYEITFNSSLEHTLRMDAMCKGIDRFDQKSKFWWNIYNIIACPLSTLPFGWTYKFKMYCYKRF